jgi:DNA mismatch repair protein MutS2
MSGVPPGSTRKTSDRPAVESVPRTDMRESMTNPAISWTNGASRPAGGIAPAPLVLVPVGTDPSPCDLLHQLPIGRLDHETARAALSFAFVGGDGDVLTRLLERCPTAASAFDAADFARDLELERFVERCLPLSARGHRRPPSSSYVLRVLAAPPRERAHVAFRQGICAELASSPALCERLEELYVRLLSLRQRLARPSVGLPEGIERRLGILTATRAVIESLVHDFRGTTSGLARLQQHGAAIAQSAGYRRLCELLEYEQNAAQVDLRIGLGFDGRIRSLQALELREHRSSPFYTTPFGRLWTRLLLFVRGQRASTGEILSRLVDAVFAELEPQIVYFFQLIGDLEVYLAALGLRRMAHAAGLDVCLPELGDDGPRSLAGLFNPWLIADGQPCTPCDLELSRDEQLVVITGPNSGGKTRLLQSLCLCQLLGQSGLFVPAARAELRWANGLFASLIEHAQPDRVEGRLGTELLRIRHAFERLRAGSLVVMDELCSGTNPSEGEALIVLVLEALLELSPQAFITTHFLDFAARLSQSTNRHRFLRAELDVHERPTYRFTDGVAHSSLAQRVAERLGVTRESLRELILRNNPELGGSRMLPGATGVRRAAGR